MGLTSKVVGTGIFGSLVWQRNNTQPTNAKAAHEHDSTSVSADECTCVRKPATPPLAASHPPATASVASR